MAAGMAEAAYLAQNLPKLLQNKNPREFTYTPHPFVVSVGGKWALAKFHRRYLSGYIGYLVRLAADFRYYSSLIGWFKALKYTLFRTEVFDRNG
jgi:NADH dehydrogenase FAD-containing subunit